MQTMDDIMEIVYTTCNSKHLDTMEKYYIYQETNREIQINNNTVLNNSVFDTLICYKSCQRAE
jgi:hypothetical protein